MACYWLRAVYIAAALCVASSCVLQSAWAADAPAVTTAALPPAGGSAPETPTVRPVLQGASTPFPSVAGDAIVLDPTPAATGVAQPAQRKLTEAGEIEIILKTIDSPLEDIQWVTDEAVIALSEKGTIYRSLDSGKTWKNQMPNFPAQGDSPAPRIGSIVVSDADPNYIFVLGKTRGAWFSTDMGATFTESGQSDIGDVRLHPTQKSWVLGSSMSIGCDHSVPTEAKRGDKADCFKLLHVSQDFGASWSHATSYVVQFDWSLPFGRPDGGHYLSDNVIYATIHSVQEGNQKFGVWDKNIDFHQSTDFFKTSRVVVEHGNRFLFGDHSYLFVAAVDPEQELQVQLKISRDNDTDLTFATAVLPVDLNEHSYTILDTSEGSVFLHVNHQPFADKAYAGHVYMSDWSGTVFSLSLPYNHRSEDGKCDFEKVEGLEGIYLANFIDEEQMDEEEAEEKVSTTRNRRQKGSKSKSPLAKRHDRLRTKTVITFDKGGQWSYLPAPKMDSQGKAIRCSDPKECHLHLHGITDASGPFYSSATATGLIMSTGSVGPYLQHAKGVINTYLSRDAGLTWKEVKKGSHIYEFGDHGGLIVMADDEDESDSVYYSWDQGATWTTQKISDTKILIENIVIEPAAVSQQFLVYGTQGGNGVIVHLDFAELHERECVGHDAPDTRDSDYETWTPSDGRLDGKCLLGHTIKYTRRRASSQCFNPEVFERKTYVADCQCTDEDFQCDYGFERVDADSGECRLMATKPEHPDPSLDRDCNNGQTSLRTTKGYRRVPGDTCVNGQQWDGVEIPCPSQWFKKSSHALLIIFVIVAVFALYNMYKKTECWARAGQLWQTASSYRPIKGHQPPPAPDTPDQHDEFYLQDAAPSLDEEGQKPARRLGPGTSDFQPLPPTARPMRPIPALAPAAATAEEFDPRA